MIERRFIDTPTAQMVRGTLEQVAEHRINALITGPAGVGKTEALVEAARRDRRAVLVTAAPFNRSMRAFLMLVAEAFDLDSYGYSSVPGLGGMLARSLPDKAEAGHYLVVDEAQLLSGDTLRTLLVFSDHREAPLPVVFVGNEHALKRTRANAAAFDQVMTRMTKRLPIPGISGGDIEAFCVCADVEGGEAYALMRHFGAGRNCREIDAVLREARRQTRQGSIKLPAVKAAIAALHGDEIARKHAALKDIAA